MKPVKCTIVDDNPLALDRLEGLLKLTGITFVIEKWADPEEAVIHITETKPDLVFLDVEMPGMSGFDVIKRVHQSRFFPAFVFVTGFNQYAIKAIKAEAFDYLVKPVDLDELNVCLSRLLELKQHYYFPGFENLTEREKEVHQLITEGKTSREIGKILYISKHTVDTHRRNIRKKMRNEF